MRVVEPSAAIPRGYWLRTGSRLHTRTARALANPPRADTYRNISFGINDLRVIKSLAPGKFFKPKHSASCNRFARAMHPMARASMPIRHLKSRNPGPSHESCCTEAISSVRRAERSASARRTGTAA
jgi:hypothetical protein